VKKSVKFPKIYTQKNYKVFHVFHTLYQRRVFKINLLYNSGEREREREGKREHKSERKREVRYDETILCKALGASPKGQDQDAAPQENGRLFPKCDRNNTERAEAG
jgi:hypothetical protein